MVEATLPVTTVVTGHDASSLGKVEAAWAAPAGVRTLPAVLVAVVVVAAALVGFALV